MQLVPETRVPLAATAEPAQRVSRKDEGPGKAAGFLSSEPASSGILRFQHREIAGLGTELHSHQVDGIA